MTTDSLSISAVICAYTLERWVDLQQAIRSVQHQTHPPDEIILVVDHNPQLKALAQQTFTGVSIVENQQAQGLSGARNTGITHTHGEMIAFMDEDAIAAPDWMERLLAVYQNKNVVGVGGAVIPSWSASHPDWLPDEFGWVVGCSYKGLPTTLAPVRNPIGCNMSFLKDALTAAGGFRSDMGRVGKLPVGCEETELSIRLKQRDHKAVILYEPGAKVFHKVPGWRTRWSYFTHRCYAEGRSKALVTHYVGSNDGLSSERRYIIRTLVQGVFSNINEALRHRNAASIKQAIVICIGFTLTSLGYLAGSVSGSPRKNNPPELEPERKPYPLMLLEPKHVAQNDDSDIVSQRH